MRDQDRQPKASSSLRLLERFTAVVLVAVVIALGWMLLAAYVPDLFRLASVATEVIAMVALLSTALILVSVVALLHTRN